MTKEDLKKVFYDEKNIKAMFRSLPMPKKEKILFHVADIMSSNTNYEYIDPLLLTLKKEESFLPMFRMLPYRYKGTLSARMIIELFGEERVNNSLMTPSNAHKIKMIRLCEELKGE